MAFATPRNTQDWNPVTGIRIPQHKIRNPQHAIHNPRFPCNTLHVANANSFPAASAVAHKGFLRLEKKL